MPIGYHTEGKIAYLTFDRPEVKNAINLSMLAEFEERIAEFAQNDDLWIAIVTGAGADSFTVGLDLGSMDSITGARGTPKIPAPPTRRVLTLKGADVWKPVIAAVNGYCLGGGCELLTGTDIRIAAEHASFGVPEVRWGVTPRGSGTVRLPRQIPYAVAMEMLLTGSRLSAQRAYEVGLVNEVVPADKLMETAETYAHKILGNGPIAARAIKESTVRTSGVPLSYAYEIDFRVVQPAFDSEDAAEGPKAFSEKRAPDFKGR